MLQPGVLQRHLSRRPLLWVHCEEVEQEVSAALIRLGHAPADAGLLGMQVLIAVLHSHNPVTGVASRSILGRIIVTTLMPDQVSYTCCSEL